VTGTFGKTLQAFGIWALVLLILAAIWPPPLRLPQVCGARLTPETPRVLNTLQVPLLARRHHRFGSIKKMAIKSGLSLEAYKPEKDSFAEGSV
jgi:hypothetical protein